LVFRHPIQNLVDHQADLLWNLSPLLVHLLPDVFFTEGSKSNKKQITNGDNEIMDNGENGQVEEKDSIQRPFKKKRVVSHKISFS
jgi:hypothetical protein